VSIAKRSGMRTALALAVVVAAAVVGGVIGGLIVRRNGASSPAAAPLPVETIVPSANRSPAGLSAAAIYRRDAPGVVVITDTQTQQLPATLFGGPQQQRVEVLGSGFVIDRRGDILTNDHVVQGATQVRVGFSGGATYPAKVIGADPSTDLAVIRVDAPASALQPLPLSTAGAVQVGDTVYAIGNPFGLDRTLTGGLVSAVGRTIQAPNGLSIDHAIQTDAAINHGNSGGPLLDRFGRVIGVNAQIDTGGASQGNVGVGFAIPADTARAIVRQLLATGHAAHAWLGVEVANLEPAIARAEGLPAHGALVEAVTPGGPAAKAGIRGGTHQVTVDGQTAVVGGDTIVSVDGVPVGSAAALSVAVAARHPTETVRLGIVRQGAQKTVSVVLGNAPAKA